MSSEFANFLLKSEYFKDKIIYHSNSDEINFEATLLSHDAMKKLVENHWEELLCDLLRSSPHIKNCIVLSIWRVTYKFS